MKWTIKVSFTDSKVNILDQRLRPDRWFGKFNSPGDAHEWLVEHGWSCSSAISYNPMNYYRKGNMVAVIERLLVPENIRALEVVM